MNENTKMTPLKDVDKKELYVIYCPFCDQKIVFKSYDFFDFLFRSFLLGVHFKLISICVFPNLLAFFIFIWTNYLKSARGVLLATFIYAFIIFIGKFTS